MNTQNLNSAIYTILDKLGIKEVKKVKIKENTIEFTDQLGRVLSMPVVINDGVFDYSKESEVE
jgi:hypothetical protein